MIVHLRIGVLLSNNYFIFMIVHLCYKNTLFISTMDLEW
jgi:hypothetical protein